MILEKSQSISAPTTSGPIELNTLLLSPIGASGTTLQTLLTTGLASSSSSIREFADWLETHNPLRPRVEELSISDSIVSVQTADQLHPSQTAPQPNSGPPPFSEQRAAEQLPRVTFLLGGRKTGTHELAMEMERRLGYKQISVSRLLTGDSFRARRLMDEGKVVEASIVLPLLLEKVRKYPQISDFVIVGFPRSVKQLQFFEKEFPCLSRLVYLEYSKADLLEMSLRFDARMDRVSMENAADSLFTTEQLAVFSNVTSRKAFHRIPLVFNPKHTDFGQTVVQRTWKFLGPIVKPKAQLVLGVPGAGLSSFAQLLAEGAEGTGVFDAAAAANGAVSVADLLARCQKTGKFRLVISGYPGTEEQFHSLGRVFEVTGVFFLRPASTTAMEQCRDRWLGRDATRTAADFEAKTAQVGRLVKKFRAMSMLEEVSFPENLTSVDPLFSLAQNLMKPTSLFISGVPFTGRSAHAAKIAADTGYPVIDFEQLSNKTPHGIVAAIRCSGSVVILGAPCSAEFFDQLYGTDGKALLPPPFAAILFDKTHRPMDEIVAKAQAYAEAQDPPAAEGFEVDKFTEQVETVHAQVGALKTALSGRGWTCVVNSTETEFLLPRVTLTKDASDGEDLVNEETQHGMGIVDGRHFPLHALGAAVRQELKRISLNGNRRIPMAMLGGRLVLTNALHRLSADPNEFPTLRDALDSLRGFCQLDRILP